MFNRLDKKDPGFEDALDQLLAFEDETSEAVESAVRDIIRDVRDRGDAAVLEYTQRFDRLETESAEALRVPADRLKAAADALDPLLREAIESSIARVREYHERQKAALGEGDWTFTDGEGNRLGQRVRGMARVGLYAPGGKAAYPSTVIMTAVPARVAGVDELVLTVPTPGGEVNPAVLAAAYLAGVDEVYTIGGAQAVAALAYGTQTIAPVDKIVGPGNIYVATAKNQVFGKVGIDMIAGPSEVCVVADSTADADWLVMDLFAQAEHDEMAQAILVSWDAALLQAVAEKTESALASMPRADIIRTSLADRGALILVGDAAEAAHVVNRIAPEHLEVVTADNDALLADIRFAGAIFVGEHSAEVMGDYTAGPSHVLPTSGTARFASPLGIYDFQVRSSVVDCSREGSVKLARDAAILATEEGLAAHAESANLRARD